MLGGRRGQRSQELLLAGIQGLETGPFQGRLRAVSRGIAWACLHQTLDQSGPFGLGLRRALGGTLGVTRNIFAGAHAGQNIAAGGITFVALDLQVKAGHAASVGIRWPVLRTTFRVAISKVPVGFPGRQVSCRFALLSTILHRLRTNTCGNRGAILQRGHDTQGVGTTFHSSSATAFANARAITATATTAVVTTLQVLAGRQAVKAGVSRWVAEQSHSTSLVRIIGQGYLAIPWLRRSAEATATIRAALLAGARGHAVTLTGHAKHIPAAEPAAPATAVAATFLTGARGHAGRITADNIASHIPLLVRRRHFRRPVAALRVTAATSPDDCCQQQHPTTSFSKSQPAPHVRPPFTAFTQRILQPRHPIDQPHSRGCGQLQRAFTHTCDCVSQRPSVMFKPVGQRYAVITARFCHHGQSLPA